MLAGRGNQSEMRGGGTRRPGPLKRGRRGRCRGVWAPGPVGAGLRVLLCHRVLGCCFLKNTKFPSFSQATLGLFSTSTT